MKDNPQVSTEEYEIDREELLEFGRQVSSLRRQFRVSASKSVPRVGAQYIQLLDHPD